MALLRTDEAPQRTAREESIVDDGAEGEEED